MYNLSMYTVTYLAIYLIFVFAGTDGTVSPSGWSNGEIFRHYLENHILKFASGSSKKLVILDGHKSHASVGLVEWALGKGIVLFILPPHCSHILQPLDVGCFGPLQRVYDNLCHKLIRETSATITRYNVCQVACKAYSNHSLQIIFSPPFAALASAPLIPVQSPKTNSCLLRSTRPMMNRLISQVLVVKRQWRVEYLLSLNQRICLQNYKLN